MSADDINGTYALAGMRPETGKILGDSRTSNAVPRIDLPGSTDVGGVSRVVPTVQMWGANYAIGTPFLSWQMVGEAKAHPRSKA